MSTAQKIPALNSTYEERAYLARLAALNVMFESARGGQSTRSFGASAEVSSHLFKEFLAELKSESA